MILFKSRKTHFQLLLLNVALIIFNYYSIGNWIIVYAHNHHAQLNAFIYFIWSFGPFVFSSLARPFGGIILGVWQKHIKCSLIFYLLIMLSIVELVISICQLFISVTFVEYILIFIRVLQGFLFGGLIPQILMYFYEGAENMRQRVTFNVGFFTILPTINLVISIFSYIIDPLLLWNANLVGSICALILSMFIFKNYYQYSNNAMYKQLMLKRSSLFFVLRKYKFTILRMIAFLSFMTSLFSFFMSLMPIYLIQFLHYNYLNVAVIICMASYSAIIGCIIGGYMHSKIGRKSHITLGVIIKILLYYMFRKIIANDLPTTGVCINLCMFFMGIMIAKASLIINGIFPMEARLHAVSTIYNFSFGMTGCISFIIAVLLLYLHNLYIPSLVIIGFSYLSLFSLWLTSDKDFFCYLRVLPGKHV